MPFASRFSCCSTIDFNSTLKYFPRGLWQQILYQNVRNLSNYWSVKKFAGVIFVWTKLEEKWERYADTKNAFRCQILVSRDGGACVSCKMSKVPVKCQKSKSQKRVKSSNLRTKSLKVRALLAEVVKLLACKPTVSS